MPEITAELTLTREQWELIDELMHDARVVCTACPWPYPARGEFIRDASDRAYVLTNGTEYDYLPNPEVISQLCDLGLVVVQNDYSVQLTSAGIDVYQRLRRVIGGITPNQLMDLGKWDAYCELTGTNPCAVNEGLIDGNALHNLTAFDAQFLRLEYIGWKNK